MKKGFHRIIRPLFTVAVVGFFLMNTGLNAQEKPAWRPFRICVMDFSTADTEGGKRFLNHLNQPIELPAQASIATTDPSLQALQGMIAVWEAAKSAAEKRASTKKFYEGIVKGQARPAIIGADYLAGYLGKHNDVFLLQERDLIKAAMAKLREDPDFPTNFMLNLAKATGATHLIYATVSDIRSRENTFKGYGLETKTTNYDLDVIVKLVDLVAQCTVYSNVYTAGYREQRPISNVQFDNNIFQNLMTSALEQAADELYELCKPGAQNKISVTPLP